MNFSKYDQQIWDEELADFLPMKVFDAHVHLFNQEHIRTECSWINTDLSDLETWADRLYPGRETQFLILGSPLLGIDVQAHNRWAMEQVGAAKHAIMNRLVTPSCKPEEIRRDVIECGFVGLKPYRVFSVSGDIHQCRIHEFFPHEQMEIANDLGLWVTMHLSRFHGCADEKNLNDLHEFTSQRYPNIKWILAHCARSFTYWPIQKAMERLCDMPNIWYDLSAVTDVRPMITLFQHENVERIFYGSDGVDSTYFPGKYVALGRAWQGFDVRNHNIKFPHCDARPILAIYEQLLCMKHAAEIVELSKDQIDLIFWKNGVREFGLRFSS